MYLYPLKKKLECYFFFLIFLFFQDLQFEKKINFMSFLVLEIWVVRKIIQFRVVATTSCISVSIYSWEVFLLLIFLDFLYLKAKKKLTFYLYNLMRYRAEKLRQFRLWWFNPPYFHEIILCGSWFFFHLITIVKSYKSKKKIKSIHELVTEILRKRLYGLPIFHNIMEITKMHFCRKV